MDATLPITTDDGTVFPVWNVSLAVSQTLQPDGSQPIAFAIRCVPSRLTGHPDAPTETLDSRSVIVLRGRAEEVTSEAERQAFVAVQSAVVAYLRSRGL